MAPPPKHGEISTGTKDLKTENKGNTLPNQSGEKSTVIPGNDRTPEKNNKNSAQGSPIHNDSTIPKTASPDQNNAAILDNRVKTLNGAPVSATYRTNDGQTPTVTESYNSKTKQIEVLMNNQRYERVTQENLQGQKTYSLRQIDEQGKSTGGESIGLAAIRSGKPPEAMAAEKYVTLPPPKENSPISSTAKTLQADMQQPNLKEKQVVAPSSLAETISPAKRKDAVTEINSVNRTPVLESKQDAEHSKSKEDQATPKSIQPSAQHERAIRDDHLQARSLEQVKHELDKNSPETEKQFDHATKIPELKEVKEPIKHDSINLDKHYNAPILDPKGNQINLTDRKDFIDKLGGPIQNTIGIKDGPQIIIAAAARVLDGLKAGRTPEAAVPDKQIKGDKPEDVKLAKLEDLAKRIQKLLPEETKDRAVIICDQLIKNRNEKFQGKDKELADTLRQLDATRLGILKGILVGKIHPDFSQLDQKTKTKFADVFNILIEQGRTVKGDRVQPRTEKNISQPTDSKTVPSTSNKPDKTSVIKPEKPGDTTTKVSAIKPGDPRLYIDAKLILLQAQRIFKPLTEVITKFKENKAEPKTDSTQVIRDKAVGKTVVSNETAINRAENKQQIEKQRETFTRLADRKQAIEKQKETSTKMIPQDKPFAEKTFSPREWAARQLDTKARPIQQVDESKPEAKTKPQAINPSFVPVRDEVLEKETPEQEDTIEFDPAAILKQALKSKPEVDANDKEIEQRVKEQRNRDKNKRRTRVMHKVKDGDTLKTISTRFFGEEASAPLIYHYNQRRVECIEHLGKIIALPIIGSDIMMPESDEIEAFEKANISYDHIEFGSVLTAEIKAAKEKAEKEIQSETVIQSHAGEAVNRTVLDPFLQINYKESLWEWITKTKHERIRERQYYENEHGCGVRIALQILDEGKWVEACCYEIYSTIAFRIQFHKTRGLKKSDCTLPPAKVKEMARTDFRNNWKSLRDEYES